MSEWDIKELGWNETWQGKFEIAGQVDLRPLRVASASRGQVRLVDAGKMVSASLRGRFKDRDAADFGTPIVGDWVLVDFSSGSAIVEDILERNSCFIRKAAGRSSLPQAVAANLDRVFIVTACGNDFNPRRIERYLAAVWSSGAEPVVVINKTDLPHDRVAIVEELNTVALGVETAMVNTLEEGGLDELMPLLKTGMTVALVGSSGVGKSTIVNILLGGEHQATGEVREADHKGRHTTSSRELFVTPGGVILIDTPGMRELGLFDADAGVDITFADIMDLAMGCRFRDCTHQTETDCAVAKAVELGDLTAERLDSYQKQRLEIARNERRAGENSKRRWKWIQTAIREREKIHRKQGLK